MSTSETVVKEQPPASSLEDPRMSQSRLIVEIENELEDLTVSQIPAILDKIKHIEDYLKILKSTLSNGV